MVAAYNDVHTYRVLPDKKETFAMHMKQKTNLPELKLQQTLYPVQDENTTIAGDIQVR